MKQGELISDVLNLNIIRNHVALQPGAECFAKFLLGVHREALGQCANENVRVHLALRIEHARLDCDLLSRFAQIICDLPFEEPDPVRPSDLKLRAL